MFGFPIVMERNRACFAYEGVDVFSLVQCEGKFDQVLVLVLGTGQAVDSMVESGFCRALSI